MARRLMIRHHRSDEAWTLDRPTKPLHPTSTEMHRIATLPPLGALGDRRSSSTSGSVPAF